MRLSVIAAINAVAFAAPLPGVSHSVKVEQRELFEYRKTMAAWWCVKSENLGTAPCVKKRATDEIVNKPVYALESTAADVIERMSKTTTNQEKVIQDYKNMFAQFCANGVEHMNKQTICENITLKNAYG